MPTYSDLVATILTETVACQDPGTPQSKGRDQSSYGPFGPHIPGDSGSYPTTDAAMEAVADLADRYRANDAALSRSVSRDALRMLVSRVVGELLNELAREQDASKHWPIIRERLKIRLQDVTLDIVHYVPVWLFLGQECGPFSIGPVRFIERKDWLETITDRRGQESSWMSGVRALWSGRKLTGGPWWVGMKAGGRAALRAPLSPSAWAQAFRGARRFSQPRDELHARTVAKTIHPDQWIACVAVSGFERDESRRRGVLAASVALDTIRLVLVGTDRRLLSTAADSVIPRSVERLSQIAGQDLAHGWRCNRPGLSGPPGVAQDVVSQSAALFEAAGACIAAAATSAVDAHACPKLADQWFNAVHWFGRACLADVDFVAVVMLVIALDVLSGGKQEQGILELTARLTGTALSAPVLPDGTTLRKLVERSYKLRSEVAHGSVLAVHATLDVERAHLESLAAAAIAEYAMQLHGYASTGGADARDALLTSLPAAQP